jgi:autotransporter passenger strand-loop-strand repeat protein
VHRGGTIEHDLTVPANMRLDLHGAVGGDLIVEPGGSAVVYGTVLGTIYNEGGEVEVCSGAAVEAVSDATGAKTRVAPRALIAR